MTVPSLPRVAAPALAALLRRLPQETRRDAILALRGQFVRQASGAGRLPQPVRDDLRALRADAPAAAGSGSGSGHAPGPGSALDPFSRRLGLLEREETLRRLDDELELQAEAMIAPAQALSSRFASDYRDAVRRLAETSRSHQRWILALLGASLLLGWLVASRFLGRQVMARLEAVSRTLRRADAGGDRPRVPVEGSDEIGEMARALERFLEDRQRLAEANRELEGLSYSVSHDLRAPLRHVSGFVALLRERTAGSLDEQGEHYLDAIGEAAARMGALVDDLLSFLSVRRTQLVRTAVDVGELVREVMAGLAPQVADRTVDWTVGELPPVEADRDMLRLAIGHLLANAVKFTRPRPRAEIEVGCAPAQPGGEVVLFVRDNGVGFDMRYADKLFGVFQRLHRSEDFEGTGIGLAHVRRIVERHGGRTWAEGRPGQGATFFLSLPRAAQGGPAVAAPGDGSR